MNIEKEHKKSSLMSKKKEDLVHHIMYLEHNNNVLNNTLNTQADNFAKLTNTEGELDITPQMERLAYNIMRKSCKQHEDCDKCGIYEVAHMCPAYCCEPCNWPDLEVQDD